MAQKKHFSLNDLLPGGSTYYHSSVPENRFYTWWGDTCVEQAIDQLKTIDSSNASTHTLITLNQLNEVLKANGINTLRTMQHCQLPDPGQLHVAIQTADHYILVDCDNNTVLRNDVIDTRATNIDRNALTNNTAYTIAHNLFVKHHNGQVTQITTDGSDDILYGESVHRNEFGIEKGTFWSTSGTLLAFYRMDQSMVSHYPQLNLNPDDSQAMSRCAVVQPDAYPMAGETSHQVQIGVFNTSTGKTVYLETGDANDRYFTNIAWSPDDTRIYLIEINRDQTDGSLDEYDAATGKKLRTLFTEHNDKYYEPLNPIAFLPWDEGKFIYQTRSDGYNHIYLIDLKHTVGKSFEQTKKKQLTAGTFEVITVLGFNKASKTVVYTSNEINPLQQNVFSVDVKGMKTAIGNTTGWHTPSLSPSGTMVLDKYSSPDIARRVDVAHTKTGKAITLFTAANPWDAFDMPEIKVGTLKAADGVTDLYYRMVLPTNFDPKKKYPAVVYVYGGPHAHQVDASRGWGVRGWDIYMAQRGYVMFTIDNRGSEHRGLAFEQATFRQLGTEEMRDQLCGVDYLKSLPYVDADRLGIHGWSFGGFMTSSLMCQPGTPFKVGVAGGPVIDWKYYEVMYGERYMDTPQSNPEGYRNSSLLNKAANLKGRLMVIYGGNDPVCVPQHTLSFIRACIDANTYPDLFTYPGDEHNMVGTDRVHLHEVITRYFDDHLK